MILVNLLEKNTSFNEVVETLNNNREEFHALIQSYESIKNYPDLKRLTDHLVKKIVRNVNDVNNLLNLALKGSAKAWVCAQSIADRVKTINLKENPFNFALFSACKGNAPLGVIKSFLSKTSSLIMEDSNKMTCLHWAIRNNNTPLIETLVPYFKKVDSNRHESIIFWAIKNSCTKESLEALFTSKPTMHATHGKDRGSYLHRAVRFAPHLIVPLLDQGISWGQESFILRRETPLDLAGRKNIEYMAAYKELLTYFVEKLKKTDALNPDDYLSYLILNKAQIRDIDHCLQVHKQVLKKEKNWLEFALKSDYPSLGALLKLMAEHGVSCAPSGWLHYAVERQLWDEIKSIIHATPNKNQKTFQDAMYLIPDTAIVKELIHFKVPFEETNDEGNNGFHLAAKHGLQYLINPLIEKGIDPTAINFSNASPFKTAIECRQWEFFFKLAKKTPPPSCDIQFALNRSLNQKQANIERIANIYPNMHKLPLATLFIAIELEQLDFIKYFTENQHQLELGEKEIQTYLEKYSNEDLSRLIFQVIWQKKWEYISYFSKPLDINEKLITHAFNNKAPFKVIKQLIDLGNLSVNALFLKTVSENKQQNALEFIKTYPGLSLGLADEKNRTIVHWAAIHGIIGLVEQVDEMYLDRADSDGNLPLQLADRHKQWKFIEEVLVLVKDSRSFEQAAQDYKCINYLTYHSSVADLEPIEYAAPELDDELKEFAMV